MGQVYVSRTERVYESLVRFAGKPALPLDLGDGWVADVSLDPLQERGNVLLLVFAPYNNKRYIPTLQNLQKTVSTSRMYAHDSRRKKTEMTLVHILR